MSARTPAEEDALQSDARNCVARIVEELQEAASLLVGAGFVEPSGDRPSGTEPIETLRWNLGYSAAARQWVEGDPDWQRIGYIPRIAVELIEAGTRLLLGANAIHEDPLAAAIVIHRSSVVFGSWRTELKRAQRGDGGAGPREVFEAQRAEANAAVATGTDQAMAAAVALAKRQFSSMGGDARARQRRWWWQIGCPSAREWRKANPRLGRAALARRLQKELTKHYPDGKGPEAGQRLPAGEGGYAKAVDAWVAAGELPAAQAD